MWALVVANQNSPVHIELAKSRADLDQQIQVLRREWQLVHEQVIHVLERPPALPSTLGAPASATVALSEQTTWVDSSTAPKYRLTVSRVKSGKTTAKRPKASYKFCPQCGCSWIQHLNGAAHLEPSEWEPCVCADCGCAEALE